MLHIKKRLWFTDKKHFDSLNLANKVFFSRHGGESYRYPRTSILSTQCGARR